MHRLLHVVLVLACALLAGCSGEYLQLKGDRPLSEADADSNVRRVYEGDVLTVVATLRKPENNGFTVVVVGEFVPDDPAIVSVRRGEGEGEYIVEALAVGETVLRAKVLGEERASVPIKVLARPAAS